MLLTAACGRTLKNTIIATQTPKSSAIISTSPVIVQTPAFTPNVAKKTQHPSVQTASISPVVSQTFPPTLYLTEKTQNPPTQISSTSPAIFKTHTPTRYFAENNTDTTHFTFEIINQFAHDPLAFTQGLIFYDGFFYESTGRYGSSSLRKVVVETGEILHQYDLPENLFAEGITIFQNQIIQLTWKSNIGFVYDINSFKIEKNFQYNFEGWGITNDSDNLIISVGTATIYVLDPQNFEVIRELDITDNGQPVLKINELELVNGELYANIWQSTKIAVINLATGKVTGWVELEGLFDKIEPGYQVDVLNGIAYDETNNRLFVTGKLWPAIFEIKLVPISE